MFLEGNSQKMRTALVVHDFTVFTLTLKKHSMDGSEASQHKLEAIHRDITCCIR